VSHMELQRGHEDLYRKEPSEHSSYGFPRIATLSLNLLYFCLARNLLKRFGASMQHVGDKKKSAKSRLRPIMLLGIIGYQPIAPISAWYRYRQCPSTSPDAVK